MFLMKWNNMAGGAKKNFPRAPVEGKLVLNMLSIKVHVVGK